MKLFLFKFNLSHIEPQSKIDNEIKDTGVVLYERQKDYCIL